MSATPTSPESEQARKPVTIIVNGQPKQVPHERITFEQVVNLAYDNNPPRGENVVITVTYRSEHGDHHGSLIEGQSVEVTEGMIFNVTATDKS
jgi:hypothetical protein